MKNILFSIFFMAFGLTFVCSQEIIEIEGARGIGLIAGRVSELDARRDALNEAKVEALRLAGITEHLQSYELLYTSQQDHNYSQFFSSDIHAELQGAVQSYEIVDERRIQNKTTQLFEIELTINAQVVKYDTRPDQSFITEIQGVKGIYNEGEHLEFNVYSALDAYLHIFNINDHEAYLMYPNPWEQFQRIAAGDPKSFPFGYVDYYLEKSTREPEVNRLIFVFTKEPVLFRDFKGEEQATSADHIFSWIYSLSPDLRSTDYQIFTIR